MRGTIGEVEAAPGGRDFALHFFDEVTRIITAVGTAPSEAFLTGAKALLTQKGSGQASSMYRDLQSGAPVEVDQILGDLLARGQQAGLSTPLLAAAVTQLSLYQARLDAKAA